MASDLRPSMKKMERQNPPPKQKILKNIVANTSMGTSGLTFSSESFGNGEESVAELEVLKAIINREGYLTRLMKCVSTVSRKFKPEIADIIDLVRAATLDVMETIVKWRELKKDHDAAFVWNGINYLLKIPSDLDYLADYRVIREWMGFELTRNPFCVPFAMETGVDIFADKILDPQHLEDGYATDGFVIGGISQAKLKKKYTPVAKRPFETAVGGGSPKRSGGNVSNLGVDAATRTHNIYISKRIKTESEAPAQSLVLNKDMVRIRQAEFVVMKEEEKFGKHSRDPDKRIVPFLQAQTRRTAVELQRDDRRDIEEPAKSITHAPHARLSDIGVVDAAWTPDDISNTRFESAEILNHSDDSLRPLDRGEGKVGGLLAPLESKGALSRLRKPLKPNLAGSIEFSHERKKKSLGQRLAEIARLKEDLIAEKQALEYEELQLGLAKYTRAKGRRQALGSQSAPALALAVAAAAAAGAGALVVEGGSGGGLSSNKRSSLRSVVDKFRSQRPTSLSPERDGAPASGPPSSSAGDGNYSPGPISSSSAPSPTSGNSRIESGKAQVDVKLKELGKEGDQAQHEVASMSKRELILTALKAQERVAEWSERSRSIERKRRLLDAEQGGRKGPPPSEPPNVYDFFACACQRIIRGWLGRCYAKWFRDVSTNAAVVMQAGIRGGLTRIRQRRFWQSYHAATDIQRIFRGWSARGTSAKMAKEKGLIKACIKIQKVYRGVLGRRRHQSKILLDEAVDLAKDSVDPRNVFPSDVKDLGRRIQNAIEEPLLSKFPPDEVLHLLRMCLMVMQEARGLFGLSEYSFINARHYKEVDGEHLDWYGVAKMMNRSERFIRMVRALAFAPASKPPRVIFVPESVHLLHTAQMRNPRWRLETFETMGIGAKLCCQLHKWLGAIVEISKRQKEFLAFLTSHFPDWLPQLLDLQRQIRLIDFQVTVKEKCIDILRQQQAVYSDDIFLEKRIDREILILREEVDSLKHTAREFLVKEDLLVDSQQKREDYAVVTMQIRVTKMEEELTALGRGYMDMVKGAATGDRRSQNELAEARAALATKKVNFTEVSSQLKMLQLQCERNREQRDNSGRLNSEHRTLCNLAGEGKAFHKVAELKAKLYLDEMGVNHFSRLEGKFLETFVALEKEEKRWRAEARRLFVIAERSLEDHDKSIEVIVKEAEENQKAGKHYVTPSEVELEEEREEDDKEAQLERLRQKQFIPSEVLMAPLVRPRPVIIAMARDICAHEKLMIHSEITKLMPGVFVSLNVPTNLGFALTQMQEIFDAKKCIIMSVDHGLTDLTRATFLKTLDAHLHALIPRPIVVLAIGDEANRRKTSGETYFGAHHQDLARLRDGDIKLCLEGMGWAVDQLNQRKTIRQLQSYSLEIQPPSVAFLVVVEAIFVLQSENENFFTPDRSLTPYSWRAMQRFLTSPQTMLSNLHKLTRGQSTIPRCEVMRQYLQHEHWPKPDTKERKCDRIIHAFATYVELWLQSETLTRGRGGLPKNHSRSGDGEPSLTLSRGVVEGLQSVVIVSDIVAGDPDDLTHGGESTMGWRLPAAKIMRACLQDLRVLKSAMKIDGKTYNVSAYREADNIYFDAYDPVTSQVYLSSLALADVPQMLVPNALARSEKAKNVEPPMTQKELYSRLVKLLHIGKVKKSKSARRMLYMQRDYSFLKNVTCKMSGHYVQMKCYEAALGELYFTAYIPKYSATLSFTVEEVQRLRLFHNSDKDLEFDVMESEDAKLLLSFVLDRLQISPTANLIDCKGVGYINPRILQRDSLISRSKAQGFVLKLNCAKGAGAMVMRRIVHFLGVPHLLVIRSSTPSKLLRIIVYEPRRQRSMELRISGFVRRVLTGTDSNDTKMWDKSFVKRLRLEWRGEHTLGINLTVYKAVHKIGHRRMMFVVELIDEESMKILLFDTIQSTAFVSVLSREQIIRMIHFVPPTEKVKSTFGLVAVKETIKNILWSMRSSLTASTVTEGDDAETGHYIDPQILEESFVDLLKKKDNLPRMASKFELMLELIDPHDASQGFETKEMAPIQVVFLPEPREEEKKKLKLDTSLRFESPFVKKYLNDTEDGTLSVVRARQQVDWLVMEDELNKLAQRRAEEALKQLDEDVKLAGVVDESLAEVEESDRDKVIQIASEAATSSLLLGLEQKEANRLLERSKPGLTQETRRVNLLSGDGVTTVEVEEDALTDEQKEILSQGEVPIFEAGIKVNFKDSKARWQGHISLRVYESLCWMAETGPGRRLRFVVFDPNSSQYSEGIIRNSKYLREVCGVHGKDLLEKKKTTEMIYFISKFRMFLVKNEKNVDGSPTDPEQNLPQYRVEFDSDKLFTADKVTPINAGPSEDVKVNVMKLIDLESKRGQKILRLARRISGVLMQLTIFEIPTDPKDRVERPAEIEAVTFTVHNVGDPSAGGGRESGGGPLLLGNGNNDDDDDDSPTATRQALALPHGGHSDQKKPNLKIFEPPTFRVVGYDPHSKRKVILVVPPRAALEVAGGIYSPYLEPQRRRELARVVAEALFLVYPRAKPFELMVRWSGTIKQAAGAVAGKASWRSNADRVIKRPGKLFRAAMRITKVEVLVTIYAMAMPKIVEISAEADEVERDERAAVVARKKVREDKALAKVLEDEAIAAVLEQDAPVAVEKRHLRAIDDGTGPDDSKEAAAGSNDGHALGGTSGGQGLGLVVNFYSTQASEATEVVVTEEEQADRLGRVLLAFPEGTIRSAAARRLCRFFFADLIEDPEDMNKKILKVSLLGPKKGFVSEYLDVKAPDKGDANIRPVGVPQVFMPLDTCGYVLHRRGMTIVNKNTALGSKDYIVTVFTKSSSEHPERGLVLKLYERGHSYTAVLHLGPSTLIKLCADAKEPDLLRDLVRARELADQEKLDGLETRFVALTSKGELVARSERLINQLVDIVLADLGVSSDPTDALVPYSRSAPRGIAPI